MGSSVSEQVCFFLLIKQSDRRVCGSEVNTSFTATHAPQQPCVQREVSLRETGVAKVELEKREGGRQTVGQELP